MERTKIQNDKMFMLQDEVYSDSVIPFLKKELKRKVDLYGKVELKGGIFCQNLDVDAGDIFVQKSVHVEEGISIKGKEGGLVWFNSPVNSEHSILVDEKSDATVRFGKSVRSASINLHNTIVYGNVLGDNVTLKNSVVLGGVFSKNKIVIDNSIVGTYHCNSLVHYNNFGILYPMAISEERPELSKNIYMVVPGSSINGDKGGIYKLGEEDFYPLFVDGKKQYVFSNTLKIFDLNSFQENLQDSIERLFDATTKNIDDIDNVKKNYADFDNRYFDIINSNFKISKKKLWSDFMQLDKKVVDEYFNADNKTEDENQEEPEKVTMDELNQVTNIEETRLNEANLTSTPNNQVLSEVNLKSDSDDNIIQVGDRIKLKDDAYESLTKFGEIYTVKEILNENIKLEEFPGNLFQAKNYVVHSTNETTICSNCGQINSNELLFCSSCGKKLNVNLREQAGNGNGVEKDRFNVGDSVTLKENTPDSWTEFGETYQVTEIIDEDYFKLGGFRGNFSSKNYKLVNDNIVDKNNDNTNDKKEKIEGNANVNCPKCGTANPKEFEFCFSCGTKIR